LVNDETLNEFVVTVERRDVGETYAKNDRDKRDREDRDKRDEVDREEELQKKQRIRMKNKNYQNSILKYQLKFVPLHPLNNK